ncbi:MAG: response regulator transcription factor [Epsilonproteobacteria bacterium]|nr:response regulator transcription factor [Campylobacterota bacterium]
MKVLVVEDDRELNHTIAKYLTKEGFEVEQCFDTLCAKDKLEKSRFDLLLLDVKLPYEDGFSFLENNPAPPTIFITSLNSIEDITRGFNAGAIEYIKKPFYLKELKLRIESLFNKNPLEEVKIGEITYFPKKLMLKRDNTLFYLKPKEAQLLELLISSPNTIIPKEELLERLEVSEGALRAHVKNLRKLVGKTQIETIKGVGYRFVS